MPKRSIWMISPMALILACVLSPILGAQTAPPKSVDDIKIDKWNSAPLRGTAYDGSEVGPCSAPRPLRNLGRDRGCGRRPAARNPTDGRE